MAGYSVRIPERGQEITVMVWKAMFAGLMATCLTAAVAGAMPSDPPGAEAKP